MATKSKKDGRDNLIPGGHRTHGGYLALRKAKEGIYPDKRTKLGMALTSFQGELEDHFNGFNSIQRVYFSTIMVPLFIFLWECDPISGDGWHFDWKWSLSRLDNCYQKLVQLADSKPSKAIESLEQYLVRVDKESKGR